jgi:hypothetical protein
LLLFFLASCEKEEDRIIAKTQGAGAALSASANNLVLQKANAANEAVKFTWNKADYGFNAALTNTLQIAAAGSNFANPKEVVFAGNVSSKSFTVLELNALLLSMKLPTGANSNIETRVKTEVTGSEALAPVYSNVVNLPRKDGTWLTAMPAEVK